MSVGAIGAAVVVVFVVAVVLVRRRRAWREAVRLDARRRAQFVEHERREWIHDR